ncbi:MAG: beta-eliminating lyase-related protein [Clostridiales bacterium]|nr:beta-eliminating lyase-related protein [Clostridiales bacterium]
MRSPVTEKIRAAATAYPLHMPGHKRNPAFMPALSCAEDITELADFDDLHRPRGVLRESMDFAAGLYGARRSYYLVNSSTGGILAAIAAACPRGGKVLLARNCHISAWHAAELLDLDIVLAEPAWLGDWGLYGGLGVDTLTDALDAHADIALVVVVSPTYEGIVSDIPALAALCHARGVPLLCDAAHGAHLGFCSDFPQSAVGGGADIVVQSLHKTLPAPTQCAILHVCSERVGVDAVEHALRIFQTSSPSYLLVAAMDACLRLMEREGAALLAAHAERLERFYRKAEGLAHLRVLPRSILDAPDRDISKIWISTHGTDIDGAQLCETLFARGFALERQNPAGALAMTSFCDTDAALERFAHVLLAVDAGLLSRTAPPLPPPPAPLGGRYVYTCPPGIPM